MTAKLLDASDLSLAAIAARKCYGRASMSQGDNLTMDDLTLLRRIVLEFDPPHDSIIEHIKFTWDITGISRACSHQLVRHRIASFSQQSQRYVSESSFDYVIPPSISADKNALNAYHKAMACIRSVYQEMRGLKIPRQDARFVLPNACRTSMIVTLNARSLRNFLKLRLDKNAQWEIRDLAWSMYESLPGNYKFLFEQEVRNG